MIQCNWVTGHDELGYNKKRPRKAAELILYGCRNMHTGEAPFCTTHAEEWLRTQQNGGYMCDQPPCEADIIEWFAIQTHRLLQGYKRPHDPHNMP